MHCRDVEGSGWGEAKDSATNTLVSNKKKNQDALRKLSLYLHAKVDVLLVVVDGGPRVRRGSQGRLLKNKRAWAQGGRDGRTDGRREGEEEEEKV